MISHRQLGCILLLAAGIVGTIASAQTLERVTISKGGGVLADGLIVSVGQPLVGTMSSSNYALELGVVPLLLAACTPRTYGDIHPIGSGNGIVDLDDIFCVLDGFANNADCPQADIYPCGGNALIDLDDIFAVLDAFAADFACPAPCL